MNVYEMIRRRRTIRQFQARPVPRDLLIRMVDAARLAPSAANRQPLEFVVVDEPEVRARIFPCLKWAAYITPRGNPRPGQEPAAYVAVLVNTGIRKSMFEWDVGAAMENMILTGLAESVGSCWIVSVDKDAVHEILSLPEDFAVDSVLALGYPAEDPQVEDLTDSVEYWKDEEDRLHVPKRRLETILHFNRF